MGERKVIARISIRIQDDGGRTDFKTLIKIYDQESSMRTIFSWANSQANKVSGTLEDVYLTLES
jgi:hypothetical protein